MTGAQNYEERVQDEAKMGGKITLKVDQVRAVGKDGALAAGSYQITYAANPAGSQFEGNWLRVFARQAADWKIIASTFTPVTTPTATGATGAQPPTGTSTPPATGKTLK
jgi:ketosteroid isomerase-like protein